MSTNVTLNNVVYAIPAVGESNWGSAVSSYLIALSTGVLSKAGGSFTLTADTDFGASFGLKSVYYKSRGTAAAGGVLRLGNAELISWRNAANGADLSIKVSASDWLQFNGVNLADISSAQTLTNKTVDVSANTFTNIVNANISASAAIAYSKLNLSASIVNADISASAAIAYSKLNLSGSIVNADVAAAAAIARTKLGTGTADHVLINAGDGTFSSEAQLDKTRGGTGISTTAVFPTSGTITTNAGVQTLTNKTITGCEAANLVRGSGSFTFNSSGALVAPNATDTLVGKATTDILTNKTLTGNTAVNLVSGSGTLTLNTAGTVTLPNATDTLVGKATTDTLTNKTLTSPTIAGPTVTGTLLLQNPSGAQPELHLSEDPDNGTNVVKIKAPDSLAADYTLTLPPDDGNSNEVLSTNGSGTLSWVAALTTGLNDKNVSIGNASNIATATNTNLLGDAVASTASATITVTIATPGVVSHTAHGLSTGDKVYYTTTGALPTGLTASTTYYVVAIDANSYSLATTLANALAATKIATSGSQSGVHTAWTGGIKIPDASATVEGIVNTTTQTIAGVKTFSSAMVVGAGATFTNGTALYSPTNFSYYEEGSFTLTASNFGSSTGTCYFIRCGSMVTLLIPAITGTGTSTPLGLTGLLARLSPARNQSHAAAVAHNSGTYIIGRATIASAGTTILLKLPSGGDLTASGTCGTDYFTMTYLLT